MTEVRPLLFARVQFDRDRDGCAEWIKSVFKGELSAIWQDIKSAREVGASTTAFYQEAVWAQNLLADIESEMAGLRDTMRMRVYRGGQADWAQGVLRDEQAILYEDLGELRKQGVPESDPRAVSLRQRLTWSVNVLRDLDAAMISLVGPDEDPR